MEKGRKGETIRAIHRWLGEKRGRQGEGKWKKGKGEWTGQMHNEEGSEKENNKDDTQVIVGRKGKEGEEGKV